MGPSPSPAPPPSAEGAPSLGELYLGFAQIGLSAFGGALPWARRILVERRRWMEPEDFASTLALCQFLPGPNIVNLSIAVGRRFHGAAGSAAAFAGLVGGPMVLVVILGLLYERFGGIGALHGALTGLAAGAAGLVSAAAAQMARPALRKTPASAPALTGAAFVLAGLLRWPLPLVLLVLAPIGVALSWRAARARA
ncbi:MAG: chromate transporter [Caulobacteraceae bacterium]|nr:chromate transporter [Caulobacteraceae bacterium]